MKDRKQNVIKLAHELFIEKGFQATSIQDILDYSGISKGTFYNYFSSKSELLLAIFKSINSKLEKGRNDLLIGESLTDIEVFIKQIELQVKTNRRNKLFSLFEEVFMSNESELKQFIRNYQMTELRWLNRRLIDIFGENKKPYLLDCSIMFMGILKQNIYFNFMEKKSNLNINHIVRYSVERLVNMVEEVSKAGDQLLEPVVLNKWLPEPTEASQVKDDILHSAHVLKQSIENQLEEESVWLKYDELIDFLLDELLQTESFRPRKFLIESAISSLREGEMASWKVELENFVHIISAYIELVEGNHK